MPVLMVGKKKLSQKKRAMLELSKYQGPQIVGSQRLHPTRINDAQYRTSASKTPSKTELCHKRTFRTLFALP
jgi:hypothetical protein